MRRADFAVIAIVLLTIFLLGKKAVSTRPEEVRIESSGGTWVYALDENREVAVSGPLGITTVRIQDGTVRIASSPCPNQTCVQQGEVRSAGSFIACLPNGVLVTVEGGTEEAVDAITD